MSSITKRPSGRWRARFRDAHGTEHAKHFATRTQARAWLESADAAERAGVWVPPRAGEITLARFYRQHAERQLWQPTTRRAADHTIATCPLRDRRLGELRRPDIEAWVKAMTDRGLAPSTVSTRYSVVRGVLSGAVRDGVLGFNPALGVRLPRAVARTRAAVLPTRSQLARLLDAADGPLGPAVALSALAGLRMGELRGLQVRDLDLAAGTLSVRRQVRSTAGGGWETSPPKYGSFRVVPLPQDLITRLQRHLDTTGPSSGPEDWVVAGTTGGPIHPGTLHRGWQRAKTMVGLDPGLRLHDLRHYYASELIAAGVDVLTVQHRLGHARASTTLDVYGHVLPRTEEARR